MQQHLTIAVIAACPFPYTRGTPIRIQRLSETLSAFGHTIHIFTYPIGQGALSEDIQVSRVVNLLRYKKYDSGPSLQKPFLDTLMVLRLAHFLAQTRVDILYAHHFEGALVALTARGTRDIPIVYDAHTTLSGELDSYHSIFKSRAVASVGSWLDSFVPRMSNHILSVSDEIAEILYRQGIPQDRVTVIPNGTECEELAQGNAARARERFHLEDRPTIIYTGNFALFQGIQYLIEAMPKVLAAHPDAQLVLAGSGDTRPYLESIATLNIQHAIHFVHEPTFVEVTDLLALGDVAVSPRTVCPGIPLKLVNYMAAGKAIVAFEGSAKALTHLKTGYIVPNENIAALAEGIATLLINKELRERLGAKAQYEASMTYTWERMASKVVNVFEYLTREQALALV